MFYVARRCQVWTRVTEKLTDQKKQGKANRTKNPKYEEKETKNINQNSSKS